MYPVAGIIGESMNTPVYHHALAAGQRIEEFELKSVLGAGGFGVTYMGFDHQFHRDVAIKEYLPGEIAMRDPASANVIPRCDADRENYQYGLDRFLDEARLLAKFDGPHVVRVHRYLQANGTAYLVMEFREGETLAQLLSRRKQPLMEDEVRRILHEVLLGLHEVHSRDYLHRDIKPSNIYMRRDGPCMLIDFGAARYAIGEHSRSLMGMMTPGYAPYEQYSFTTKQGPFTDLYATGATLYRCLTTRAPIESGERIAAVTDGREDPYKPVAAIAAGQYDDALLATVDWMLQLRAVDRPQSVSEVLEVLEGAPTLPRSRPSFSGPQDATVQLPLTPSYRTRRTQRGEPGWIGERLGEQIRQFENSLLGGSKVRAFRSKLAALENAWVADFTRGVFALSGGLRDYWLRFEASPRGRASVALIFILTVFLFGAYRLTNSVRNPSPTPVEKAAIATAEPEGMVIIPTGSSVIGNIAVDDDDDDLYPQTFRVTRPFAMGRHEVTFAEYDRFADATGRDQPDDMGWGRGSRPVINVSWDDAHTYAAWLSQQTGKRYRLPSEAEWEFAARGGRRGNYWWGGAIGNGHANCQNCGSPWDGKMTAPAGSFSLNPYGLQDTAGNVAEWTCSFAGGSQVALSASCAEPANPRRRAVRGGSWKDPGYSLASWARASEKPETTSPQIGFRLLMELNREKAKTTP